MSNRYLQLFLTSNILIILDQYTKMWVNAHIPKHHYITVIDNFFAITHIRNPGVAFGLFAEGPSEYKTYLFIGFSVIAIVAILIFFHQTPQKNRMVRIGLILIFSGAIGNLIDRILYQEVIDFLDFYYGAYHWPAFNIADSCITIGVLLMFADLIQAGRASQVEDSSDTPESA
ncbi:MAG: signal peptidase II [Nitrospinota bacterium]|nr:signal peptidase II [Nitrospinota bacterium]